MFNLMEQPACLLLDIGRGLGLEALSGFKDLLGTLEGIEDKEGFIFFRSPLVCLGAVLLPNFFHKFLVFLVLIDTNSRSNRLSSDDDLLDGKRFEFSLCL